MSRAAALTTLLLAVLVAAAGALAADPGGSRVRVTVFGDSAATAMAYNPDAKRILGRGIDLRLEAATCRRLASLSCPYDGVRPPTVVERATELGPELGPVVVVIVGYNDYEATHAEAIAETLAAFRKAGVQRVVWATLREQRQSWARMNGDIFAAAKKNLEMTVLDWNAEAVRHPEWLQPDGTHLTAEGARGMAGLVNSALVELGHAPKPSPPTPVRRLSIASGSLAGGHVGRPYANRFRALGGKAPYRWLRAGGALPVGLRLTSDGRLAGVPVRAGRFSFVLRLVDGAGTARAKRYALSITR